MRTLISPLLLLALLSLLGGCQRSHPPQQQQLYVFGTLLDITLWDVPAVKAQQAFTQLGQEFQHMHRSWHAWEPSDLTALNDAIAAGRPHEVPTHLLPLLTRGQALYRQSAGLFNPAIGHLLNAWGFQQSEPPDQPPPEAEVIRRLVAAAPGMDDLRIDGHRVSSRNRQVKLDLGGYGKGYGIDLAIARLRELGIHNAIINAGGDLRAIGSKQGRPWRVGVRHPQGEGILAAIEVQGDESVFTSGNYERYNAHQGVRYQHILDPRTGQPVEGVTSVTVIHDNGTEADAASTALVVAGVDRWHEIAQSMGIRYAMLVTDEGRVHLNPAMRERLRFQGSPPKLALSPPLRPEKTTQK